MFKKWWRRRQERRAAQKRKDAEAIIDVRREVEQWDRREDDLTDFDKLLPVFTDLSGGPL